MITPPYKTIAELCAAAEALNGPNPPAFFKQTIDQLREWIKPDPFRGQAISRLTRQKDEAQHLVAIGGMLEFGTLGCTQSPELAANFYKAARERSPEAADQLIHALHGKAPPTADVLPFQRPNRPGNPRPA
jgi:TPR repeat protein